MRSIQLSGTHVGLHVTSLGDWAYIEPAAMGPKRPNTESSAYESTSGFKSLDVNSIST